MTLRLVLVSIVACLGLSLPSAERLERWTRSSQAWMNGGHPEWENGEPLDEGRFVVVADAVDVPTLVSPLPRNEDAANSTIAPTSVVLTPHDDAEAKAWEANWQAAIEREAAPPSATAVDPTIGLVSAEEEAPAVISEAVVAVPAIVSEAESTWWDALLAKLALPCWSVQTPIGLPTSTAEAAQVDLSDAAFSAIVEDMACSMEFAAAPVDLGDAAFSAIVEEMASAFAKDSAAHAAAVVPQTTACPTVAASSPEAPILEPGAIDEDLPAEVASVLDREAQGQAPATALAAKAPSPDENRLSHAVRLTREAVNAWANLLHGPALVTIER